jgi:hypothetical protein
MRDGLILMRSWHGKCVRFRYPNRRTVPVR